MHLAPRQGMHPLQIMPRNSEEYSYSSYPENYYDSYDMQHPQQQQQQQQPHYHHQQHPQQHQQHYPHLASGYPHPHAAYYAQGHPSQMQHDYSNQAGPSYYPGYQVAVEDEYHDESPSPSVPHEEHSPTYPTFGQFQLDTGSYGGDNNIEHIISEHELPAAEVASYFPSSNKTDIHTDKGVIWRCKMCAKEVPARNKIEHIFKHKDQPRYTCSCKAKFARGQDKNRHLKEQALCTECQATKVGRRGQNGKCQMCL